MPAQYRLIQTDFSGGEIDPLAMLNLNSGLRSIGVKESRNFIHLQSGTVSKRNSSEIAYRLSDAYGGRIAAALSMQLPDKSLTFLFMEDEPSTYMVYDGEAVPSVHTITEEGLTHIHKDSHFAVYQNYIVEVNSRMKPMLYEISVESGEVKAKITRPEKWEYDRNPTSCTFAQGRLFLAFGNTVIGSRTPDGDKQRFFDFTLADYEYEEEVSSKVHYSEGAVDEWVYAWLFFKGDEHISSASVAAKEWNELKALPSCYKEVYTYDKTFQTAQEEEIRDVDSSGARIKRTYNRKTYTVTRMLTGGIADTENIICRTYVLTQGGAAASKVVTESVDEFPDGSTFKNDGNDRFLNQGRQLSRSESTPYVYSDHAIEVNESDMYGSQIKWIANIGRIIVATNNSLFISTADTISPSTFDLTPTAYIGASGLQPKIISNMLLWCSLDKRKLYAAVYSYELQGLQTMELTASAYHLFHKGIRQFEVADTPQLSVYAITDDDSLRVCSLIQTANGTMSPWCTWSFPASPDYVFVHRTSEGNALYIAEGNDAARIRDSAIYDYGEKSTGLLMDNIQEIDAGDADEAEIPGSSVYENADEIGVILHDLTDRTIPDYVTRRAKVSGGKLSIRRTAAQKGHSIRVTIGITYEASLTLFTPVLPSNSGSSLLSYHSVARLDLSLYKSLGGEIRTQSSNGQLYIKQLSFGSSRYTDSFLDDDGRPLAFTGVYGIDNPTTTTREDNITIVSKDPYPFNVMAVAQTIRITEVS